MVLFACCCLLGGAGAGVTRGTFPRHETPPIVPRGPTNNSDLKAGGPAYKHTYKTHVNKTAGALDCQATCDTDARCRSWTYVPYGDAPSGPGARERCCLFLHVGCPAVRQGVVSGARTAGPCSVPAPPPAPQPSPAPAPPPGPPAPWSKRMVGASTDAMLFFDNRFIEKSVGLKAHVGESTLVGTFVDPTVRYLYSMAHCFVCIQHLFAMSPTAGRVVH